VRIIVVFFILIISLPGLTASDYPLWYLQTFITESTVMVNYHFS